MCVSAAEASPMRSNLEANGAAALGFCPPTIAKAVQLKGVAVVLGEPDREDLERVEPHLHAFKAECTRIGVGPEVAGRMFDGSALVPISVAIDEASPRRSLCSRRIAARARRPSRRRRRVERRCQLRTTRRMTASSSMATT